MFSPSFPRKATITDINPYIIETHILTKLDGHSLASLTAASPQLNALCSNENVWSKICNSTWPSTKHPLLSTTISNFKGGHRVFFSDSFPVLRHILNTDFHQLIISQGSSTDHLISAVDIFYKNNVLSTKVDVTDTKTDCFLDSTFRIDLFNYEKCARTIIPGKFEENDYKEKKLICMNDLKKNMTLSWIIIDPTHKRAVNVSSWRPVSVRSHWDGGDIEVKYATVVGGGYMEDEVVEFRVVVMLGWEGEELEMRSVKLQMRDVDDIYLSGKDSLVILQDVINSINREKGKEGEVTETYKKLLNVKRV